MTSAPSNNPINGKINVYYGTGRDGVVTRSSNQTEKFINATTYTVDTAATITPDSGSGFRTMAIFATNKIAIGSSSGSMGHLEAIGLNSSSSGLGGSAPTGSTGGSGLLQHQRAFAMAYGLSGANPDLLVTPAEIAHCGQAGASGGIGTSGTPASGGGGGGAYTMGGGGSPPGSSTGSAGSAGVGGAGGGIIILCAPIVDVTFGTIVANGANGNVGTNNSGAGGGGGGGTIFIICEELIDPSNRIGAQGGNGGLVSGTTGTAGTGGSTFSAGTSATAGANGGGNGGGGSGGIIVIMKPRTTQ